MCRHKAGSPATPAGAPCRAVHRKRAPAAAARGTPGSGHRQVVARHALARRCLSACACPLRACGDGVSAGVPPAVPAEAIKGMRRIQYDELSPEQIEAARRRRRREVEK